MHQKIEYKITAWWEEGLTRDLSKLKFERQMTNNNKRQPASIFSTMNISDSAEIPLVTTLRSVLANKYGNFYDSKECSPINFVIICTYGWDPQVP